MRGRHPASRILMRGAGKFTRPTLRGDCTRLVGNAYILILRTYHLPDLGGLIVNTTQYYNQSEVLPEIWNGRSRSGWHTVLWLGRQSEITSPYLTVPNPSVPVPVINKSAIPDYSYGVVHVLGARDSEVRLELETGYLPRTGPEAY